jgi:pimeloyl-ACP methyl ester carboxylesterase
MPSSLTRTVADIDLDCISIGSGPPLLFLHGLDGRAASIPLIEQLATEYTVFAPSTPGWDNAPRVERLSTIVDVAELYAELHEELGATVPIVGCSLGGWIAVQMAATVRRVTPELVLVSPLGLKIGARESRAFLDLFVAGDAEILAAKYSSAKSYPKFNEWSNEQFLHFARAQESVAWYAWQPYLHDPKLIHRLRRVAARTLLVYGTADGLNLNHSSYAEMASRIGEQAELVAFEGAGHALEQEDPARLASLIKAFLQRSESTSGEDDGF